MLEHLRAGTLTDSAFDALWPEDVREVAPRYWTPLAVARRVAELLVELGARCVLDVGSGCGKFGIAVGAQVPQLEVCGVEQRPRLVEVATAMAQRFELSNVAFRQGDATKALRDGYDAVYLFNPFAENLFPRDERIDDTVELSRARLRRDLLEVELALKRVPMGTLVVTYHGFGGRVPDSFDVVRTVRAGTDRICVLAKARERAHPRAYLVEMDEGWVRAESAAP